MTELVLLYAITIRIKNITMYAYIESQLWTFPTLKNPALQIFRLHICIFFYWIIHFYFTYRFTAIYAYIR